MSAPIPPFNLLEFAGVIASLAGFSGLVMRHRFSREGKAAGLYSNNHRTQVWSEMTNVFSEKGICMYAFDGQLTRTPLNE